MNGIKVKFTGQLGSDPELRTSQAGNRYALLSVAVGNGILKVQARVIRLYGLGSGIGGDERVSEAAIIARIRAEAPVLRPDSALPPIPSSEGQG